MNEQNTKVGIVGATGFAGMELVRLVLNHPRLSLTYLAGSRTREESFGTLFPNLLHLNGPDIVAFDPVACKEACDIVFVALPSGESGQIAAKLWEHGVKVIDLSGDLRLPAAIYRDWYGKEPVSVFAQQAAVYGLSEFARNEVATASLISNPGCYATAALLALKPLQSAPFVEADRPIIIDAKSGVTGAGRSAKTHLHFAELADDFYAYKVGAHQHTPEIEQAIDHAFPVLMTTQLLPTARGIEASVYVPVTKEADASAIYQLYQETYTNEPFVHVLPVGVYPHIKAVRNSNMCHIGLHLNERTNVLQVFSVIDNLQKGASGQALQNANIMLGFDESMGLMDVSSWM